MKKKYIEIEGAVSSKRVVAPTLKPGEISEKGCNYIFPPAGQAGEYSRLAVNHYRDCGHTSHVPF